MKAEVLSPLLIDTFGRKHDYLRISLTDACNLRCSYCMPNEQLALTPSSKLMSLSEIQSIASIFVSLGIKKIRLTGGEPLVRKDVAEIIKSLSQLPVELTLSTNAFWIDKYINELKESTIRSVNVSLDSFNEEEFKKITKRNDFKKIISNIELLLNNKFNVKINMVVIKGVNDHALLEFVEYTRHHLVDVRFIEFMPFDGNRWKNNMVLSYKELVQSIEAKYEIEKLADEKNSTSKKYKVKNFAGNFGFISTITSPFCEGCNRLRLTADGKIKNCLFSQTETDLLTPFREGKNIIPLIFGNVKNKKAERGGQFVALLENQEITNADWIKNRSMIKIGG